MQSKKPVRIINVPLDLGASRRGTDAGPSAFRVAGLSGALRKIGLTISKESDIPVPAMETRKSESTRLRFKSEILDVCRQLATETLDTLESGEQPLVVGGDHSIAMGTVSGLSAHFRKKNPSIGLIWCDAHGDMNLPETSPSGDIHGMPLAHLLGYGDEELSFYFERRFRGECEECGLVGYS